MFVHTGDYVEHVGDDIFQSTYYTFTPLPLMRGQFYTMDDDLAVLLAETRQLLGVLEGMTSFLSDREALADLILLRECCFSKMIDYPDFDIRSVLAEQGAGNPNSYIRNIVSAYRYAIGTSVRKLSYNSIITHALSGNDESKRRVTIRTKPLFLTKSASNYHQYNPTAPSKIQPALDDIRDYIDSSNTDMLVKAAMCHYQLEMIHPYECYNGIVGRILPYHIFSNAKLNGTRFCSISASLYRHKAEYFDKLVSTQKNGNYAMWIEFLVRIIGEAAQQSVEFIRYYETIAQHDEENILTRHHDRADRTLDVYRHFKRNIVSSIGYASEKLSLSFDTASRSVGILQNLGILSQITQGSRNRLFAHAGLMDRLISPE